MLRRFRSRRVAWGYNDVVDHDDEDNVVPASKDRTHRASPSSLLDAIHVQVNVVPPSVVARDDPPSCPNDDDDDDGDDDDDYDDPLDSPTASSGASTGALAERGRGAACAPDALCFRSFDRVPPAADDESTTSAGSFLRNGEPLALAHAHAYVPTPPMRRTKRDAAAAEKLKLTFLEIAASSRRRGVDALDCAETSQGTNRHDSHHEAFDIEMVIPANYAPKESTGRDNEAKHTIMSSASFISPLRALSPLRSCRVVSSPPRCFKKKESSTANEEEHRSTSVDPMATAAETTDAYPSKQAWSRIRRAIITAKRSPSPKTDLAIQHRANRDPLQRNSSRPRRRSPSPKRRDSSANKDSSTNVVDGSSPSSNPFVATTTKIYQSKQDSSGIQKEIVPPSRTRQYSPFVVVATPSSSNRDTLKQALSRIHRAVTPQRSPPSPKKRDSSNKVVVDASPPSLDPIAASANRDPPKMALSRIRRRSPSPKRDSSTKRGSSTNRDSSAKRGSSTKRDSSTKRGSSTKRDSSTNRDSSTKRDSSTNGDSSTKRGSSNKVVVDACPPSLDPIAANTSRDPPKMALSRIRRRSPSPKRDSSTSRVSSTKRDSSTKKGSSTKRGSSTNRGSSTDRGSSTERDSSTNRGSSTKRDSSIRVVDASPPPLDPIATGTNRDPPKKTLSRLRREITPPSRMTYSSHISRSIPIAKQGNGTHVFMDRFFKNRRRDVANSMNERKHENIKAKIEQQQQQQEGLMAKDDHIAKYSSVPDPPASPSWKIGGTLSPKQQQQQWRKQQWRGIKQRNQSSGLSNDVREERWQSQSKEHSPQHHRREVQQRQQVEQKQQVLETQQVKRSPHDELKFQQQQQPMARRQEIPLHDEQRIPQHQEPPRQRRDLENYQPLPKSKSLQLHQNESRMTSQPSEPRKKQQYTQPEMSQERKIQHQPQQHESQEQNQPDQSAQKSKQPYPHPIRPKQQENQPQQKNQPKQLKESLAQNNQDAEDLNATVALKKVLSSPSVMISTLTSQTMNTTNTTTTSKFWDGIEDHEPAIAISPTSPNHSLDTGIHGNPKKFSNIADEEFAILKKLNSKNKELQEFFKHRRSEDNLQSSIQNWSTPPKSGTPALTQGLASPAESDSASNAFSLNLPMNKHGYFDDSDISALAMGDSATVYHMRASAAAKNNNQATDYWKEKYERLKEETRRANQLRRVMNEALLEEGEDEVVPPGPLASTLEGVQQPSKKMKDGGNAIKDTPFTIEDDESQLLQQQEFLRRCGYGGGKKAKDLARKLADERDQPSAIRNVEFKSFLNRAQCLRPFSHSDASVDSAKRDELDPNLRFGKDIANPIQCPRLVLGDDLLLGVTNGERNDQKLDTRKRSADVVPDVQVMAETFSQEEEGIDLFGPTEESFGFESINSDIIPLRQIGYVQRMETPSPRLKAPRTKPVDALDAFGIDGNVLYVMDDAHALKQWNKNRSSKALADELSAAGSHGRTSKVSSTDGSELSESAKLIFEAALKHDINALREQRSRSSSRNPDSRSRIEARDDPVDIVRSVTPEKYSVSSPTASSSVISNRFASNIPQDFATWFELPSPGTSCIALIPILNGHLKNAVIIDLLSGFDAASNTIDANGVHRIAPRHRVNDVLRKSLNDFMDSPLISCKSTADSEYMGPIIADGDRGSIRFADPSLHLGRISDAATTHIKKREFQDAIDIYTTLLRSCQALSESKLGLVGQLLASTLHNLCVVHLWKEEFDLAMPYCRECLRIKTESSNDNLLMAHSWANMGLIHYSMEAHTSAIMSFRNAIQLSAGISVDGRTSLSGRLQNNLACVNVEMGSLELALSEFEQSLRWQKDSSSSNDADTSDAENLLSISLTIFNIAVTCARQKHYHAAFKHTEASHAMQEALLGHNNELTLNTLFYYSLIKKVIATSEGPDTKTHKNVPQNQTLGSPRRITRTRTDEVLDILDFNPASPGRQVNSENDTATKHGVSFFSKSNEISYPMLSLGSLKVEATTVEQVRDCLDRYDTNLSKGKDRMNHVSIMRNLLCKKPIHGTKQPSISSKLMNFGLKTLRKREMQAELHENLERYGPRHPLVGQAHHSLALVLLCIESYEESISHFDKSIRINTHALGVKHPDVSSSLMFMALAQFALERFDDAMTSMLRVRRMRESQLGKKHPEIYQILNNLACVQFERGDLKQAESMLQESLDLQREIFRTEHEFLRGVSTVLCNIAFVHAKNGAFPKALIELEGALQIRQDILFDDSSTDDITENMAYILAIHQLQHGSGNIDDITNEYITMLRKT